jgi:tRNA modification GTPase
MNRSDDTIAAIATAPGRSGIAVVRISGPESVSIANKIFSNNAEIFNNLNEIPSHRAIFGKVVDSSQQIVDEALLLVMRAPNSFTREDVVEIQCHGGRISAQRILRLALQNGARPAGPGEFSQRAFINGRLDLTQAEAILDLIHAQTERAAAAAVDQLEGGLSRKVQPVYDACITLAAQIEAGLDFPEDELSSLDSAGIERELQSIRDAVNELLSTFAEGRLLRDGAMAVICGEPNTGKSTLLNTLLQQDRAIVSDIPGTTRDSIEEPFNLDGFPLRLVDTAGLRQTGCAIEEQGIRRTNQLLDRADLVIHLIDATRPIEEIRDAQNNVRPYGTPKDRPDPSSKFQTTRLLVANKCDLIDAETRSALPEGILQMSLKTGEGVDALRGLLRDNIERGIEMSADSHATVSERHRGLLASARSEMETSLQISKHASPARDPSVELSVHVRAASQSLGEILGRECSDEILDAIFSQFCIGK